MPNRRARPSIRLLCYEETAATTVREKTMKAEDSAGLGREALAAIDGTKRRAEEGMSVRERFRRVMHYERADRIPNFEFGYWQETLPAWHEQGLPREVDDEAKAYEHFGIEGMAHAPVHIGLKGPMREKEMIEETEEHRIYRDEVGIVCEVAKDGHSSIPHYLDYPLKEPADWEWFRERLDPAGRLPESWDEVVRRLNEGGIPVSVNTGSLLGRIRNWMGFEEFAVATLQRREWIAEMMEDMARMITGALREAVGRGLRPDIGSGWEDICFNSGPICDIRLFEEVAVPMYRRITDELRRGDCDLARTDCDGNVRPLLPGFLRGGVNCMFPVEVNAGSDPVVMRAEHGKELRLMGGVDKMKLAGGKKAIERELLRLLPVVEEGGFIPHCDHRCPPTVRLDDYKFYLDLKREMFGCGKLEARY